MRNNSRQSFPYYYSSFGSVIASQLELPELNPLAPAFTSQAKQTLDSSAGINVIIGAVPREPENVTYSRKYMKMGIGFYWLSVPDVGFFYAEQDGTITVEADSESHPRIVRMWLYGFSIPAALLFMGNLPLHGSSIDMGGYGLWLTGRGGVGKSTLASYFLKKGHLLVADDLTVVTLDSGEPIAHSGTPHQKLCQDAIGRLGREKASDFVYRGIGSRIKYSVTVPQRTLMPVPLKFAVELESSSVDAPSIREIFGAEKLQMLLQNTYRGFIVKGLSLKPWHFQTCFMLAQHVRCFKVERPKKGFWEQELYDLILEKTCAK